MDSLTSTEDIFSFWKETHFHLSSFGKIVSRLKTLTKLSHMPNNILIVRLHPKEQNSAKKLENFSTNYLR